MQLNSLESTKRDDPQVRFLSLVKGDSNLWVAAKI